MYCSRTIAFQSVQVVVWCQQEECVCGHRGRQGILAAVLLFPDSPRGSFQFIQATTSNLYAALGFIAVGKVTYNEIDSQTYESDDVVSHVLRGRSSPSQRLFIVR